MTYVPLATTARHHRAITRLHGLASDLHAAIVAEREAAYGDGVPVAVAHLLDTSDDLAGVLESALRVLTVELDPGERRKYGVKRKEAAA